MYTNIFPPKQFLIFIHVLLIFPFLQQPIDDTDTLSELKSLVYSNGIPEPIIPYTVSEGTSGDSLLSNVNANATVNNPYKPIHPNILRTSVWKKLLGITIPIVTEQEYTALLRKGLSHSAHRIATDLPRTLRGERSIQPLLQSRIRLLNAFIHWEEQYVSQSSSLSPSLSSSSSTSNVLPPSVQTNRIKEFFGYQQGMGSIVAIFLYIMNEYDAFVCFIQFITNCIPEFFLAGHNRVREGCELADILFSNIDPTLHQHFVHMYGTSSSNAELMFFSRIASLYSNRLPISNTIQLWDRILASGVYFTIVCCVSECVLRRNELLTANRDAITRFQGIGSGNTNSTITKSESDTASESRSSSHCLLPIDELIRRSIDILTALSDELRILVYNFTGNSSSNSNNSKSTISLNPSLAIESTTIGALSKYRNHQQIHPPIRVRTSMENTGSNISSNKQPASLAVVPQPSHVTFLSTGEPYPISKDKTATTYSHEVGRCKTPSNDSSYASDISSSVSFEPDTTSVLNQLSSYKDPPLTYTNTPSHIQLIDQSNIPPTNEIIDTWGETTENENTNDNDDDQQTAASVIEQPSMIEGGTDDETLSEFTTPRSTVFNETTESLHTLHHSMNFEGIEENEEVNIEQDEAAVPTRRNESTTYETKIKPTNEVLQYGDLTTDPRGLTTSKGKFRTTSSTASAPFVGGYHEWTKGFSTTAPTTIGNTDTNSGTIPYHHRFLKGSSVSSTKSLIGSLSPSVAEAILLHEAFRDNPVDSLSRSFSLSTTSGNGIKRNNLSTNTGSSLLMTSPQGIHQGKLSLVLPLVNIGTTIDNNNNGTSRRDTITNNPTTTTSTSTTTTVLHTATDTIKSDNISRSVVRVTNKGESTEDDDRQVFPDDEIKSSQERQHHHRSYSNELVQLSTMTTGTETMLNYRCHSRKYLSDSAFIMSSTSDGNLSYRQSSSSSSLSARIVRNNTSRCGQEHGVQLITSHQRNGSNGSHSTGGSSHSSRNLSSIADALLNIDAEEEK